MNLLYDSGTIKTKSEGDPSSNQPHKFDIDRDKGGTWSYSLFDDELYGTVKRGQHVYFSYTETPPKEGSQRKTPYRNIQEFLTELPAHAARTNAQGASGKEAVSRATNADSQDQGSARIAPVISWRTGLACKALELAVQQSIYDTPEGDVLALADRYLAWLEERSAPVKAAPAAAQPRGNQKPVLTQRNSAAPSSETQKKNNRPFCLLHQTYLGQFPDKSWGHRVKDTDDICRGVLDAGQEAA